MEIFRVRKIEDSLISDINKCLGFIKPYQVEHHVGLGIGWFPVSQHNYLWQGWRAIRRMQ